MNSWEGVFIQSRVNNGYYNEKELPQKPWEWPKATWFNARLEAVRVREATLFSRSLRQRQSKAVPRLH